MAPISKLAMRSRAGTASPADVAHAARIDLGKSAFELKLEGRARLRAAGRARGTVCRVPGTDSDDALDELGVVLLR
jgi:hypothetical protein